MKTLTEFINEETTNESVLGIAGGVVVGLLGYTFVKGFIKGFASVGVKKLIDKHNADVVNNLENVLIPELESLLQAHPKSYDWAKSYWKKNNVEDLLKRMNGTFGSVTFVDNILSQDEWTEQDAKRINELWHKALTATKGMQKELSDNFLKIISK